MAQECCTNELCMNNETQLRLARLREQLLTNFNALLIDRIRFLEETIHRSAAAAAQSSDKYLSPATITANRLRLPSPLRRSSSARACLLQSPARSDLIHTDPGARSCPSSVDLSDTKEQRKWLLSIQRPLRTEARTSSDTITNNLSTPKHRPWSSSTHDLLSGGSVHSEKGRLESRRFACDVDDNEIRAFKAMVYMEQARKQHVRPLTRLRQALGISNNSTGNFTSCNSKKQTNS